MEKDKALALPAALHILGRELVVLLEDNRQVFFANRIGLRGVCDHRLHAHLLEAEIRKVQHILGELQIVVRKCAADVVILVLLVPLRRKALELRDNDVIAALPAARRTHAVVHFFPAVQRENHIRHLFVTERRDLIV